MFKNKFNLRKVVAIAICLTVTTIFSSCGGKSGSGNVGKSNSGDYTVKKINDWELLNLKDSVEEFRETDVVRSNTTTYTTFNRQGYIIETGLVKNERKNPREIRTYDDDNNLTSVKKLTSMFSSLSDANADYDMKFFDEMGRLTKEFRVSHNTQSKEFADSTLYRYEIEGRKETLYVNEKLRETVEYDNYRNILKRLTYKADGTENTFEEFEYTYDKVGNITSKAAYATMYYPLKEDFKREYRKVQKWEYTYDENNRLVKTNETIREAFPNLKTDKVEFHDRSIGSTSVMFDWGGNNTSNDRYVFEYDRHLNWYLKWERQGSANSLLREERSYKYFGSNGFENPREPAEDYYEE